MRDLPVLFTEASKFVAPGKYREGRSHVEYGSSLPRDITLFLHKPNESQGSELPYYTRHGPTGVLTRIGFLEPHMVVYIEAGAAVRCGGIRL